MLSVEASGPKFIYTCQDPKFVYYVVPKTGYSSIINMLTVNKIPYENCMDIDPAEYKDYFKFAFVRNPWDRVVSAYENLVVSKRFIPFEHLQDKGFDYFVNYIATQDLNYSDVHLRLQTSLIPNLDELDFLGHFENFEEDIRLVLNKIGLKGIEILHYNKSEHSHYSHYYNEVTRAIIAEKYKADIEILGYQFESRDDS